MCGICLIFRGKSSQNDQQRLKRMVASLRHRGPDGEGVFAHGHSTLGHTRLSIIDPRGGDQPMLSEDGRWCISYNGEIYNYPALREQLIKDGVTLNTHSDTEVILALYRRHGRECLAKLRGMFSLAIADRHTGRLFMARDRLGIKPLFYSWHKHNLVAASEIKGIFASGLVGPRFNPASLYNHFRYQFSISPFTSFEGVQELPPGHYLEVQPGGTPQVVRYWDLEFPRQDEHESEDERVWQQRFETALHDAARSHLVADVPIGSYLSGGLDSSVMGWLLKQHYEQPVHSFAIHLTNPQSDESGAFRPVADHLQLINHELGINDERGDFVSQLAACLYHLEQPQRLAVDIPHFLLSDFVHRHGYKVVYTGDGADEILGGYDCFRQDAIRCWGNEQPSFSKRQQLYHEEFAPIFGQDYMDFLARQHRVKQQKTVVRQFGCYPAWYDFWQILAEDSQELFTPEFNQANRQNRQMLALRRGMLPALRDRHPLNQSLYIETKTRLPGWILWKSDRLSMAHAVEARVPFMDHRLVELAARMPPAMKLRGMEEKYALKQMATPALPQLPGDYKKRGFYTPIREWFFQGGQADKALDHYLREDILKQAGLFCPQAVRRLLQQLEQTPAPADPDEQFAQIKREWLFMLVLSTQVLFRQFILKEAPCFHDIE